MGNLDGIYGDVGSGKNILAVADCKYTPREIPIYTNFKLNLPNAELIEPEELFEVFVEDSKIPAKKLVTDEAVGWIESRGSGFSDLNKYISYMEFQSRKRGLIWKCIAQLRGTLDLRWRGMERVTVYCHPRNLDASGNSEEDFRYSFIKGFQVVNLTLPYEQSKQFFSLYDTKEVILPNEFIDLQEKILFKKHPELLNKLINEIVEEISTNQSIPFRTLKSGETKFSITDDWVRDVLLNMVAKEPRKYRMEYMNYTKYIKSRLKVKFGMD